MATLPAGNYTVVVEAESRVFPDEAGAPAASVKRVRLDAAVWARVLSFVSNGGYALRAYDRFRRLTKGKHRLQPLGRRGALPHDAQGSWGESAF